MASLRPHISLEDELEKTQKAYKDGALANPLGELHHFRLRELGHEFVDQHGLGAENYVDFEKGALLAQGGSIPTSLSPPPFPDGYDETGRPQLKVWEWKRGELAILEREWNGKDGRTSLTKAWGQLPPKLKLLIVTCGLGAATQGWNESAVNGANFFYREPLGLLDKDLLYGLVNAAPYAACAIFTYWLAPLFNWRGRKMAIVITSVISSLTCLLQAVAPSWAWMLVFRFCLGIGIGIESAIIPVYAAESVPAPIRGTLVMLWQVCTAAGILAGFFCALIFYNVGGVNTQPGGSCDDYLLSQRCSINWRLMVGSPMLLPLLVILLLRKCPESPRWHIKKKQYMEAFQSLCELRESRIQAARDVFYIHCLTDVEWRVKMEQDNFLELFTVPRNFRALLASSLVLVLQQQCGINVIIYYSSEIIAKSSLHTGLELGKEVDSNMKALGASIAVGLINVICAIPAFRWIDTKGRRYLLLFTFPFMAFFMLIIGLGFGADHGRWDVDSNESRGGANTGMVLAGVYLFVAFYSFGEGPVPFTYSAECHALYVRERAMAVVVSLNWALNFVLSLTWPKMESSWGTRAAFLWYMSWNIIGIFLVLFFIPETRNRTLEELDRTFGSPARDLIRFGFEQIEYFVQRKILRQGMGDPPVLPCDKARRRQHEIDTEHEDKPFERESYVSKPEVIPKP